MLFKVGGNHRLPPTTLSPGDMVCIRICDSRGAGATSCTQGFVHNLGEDGCSIGVALESRHGDPTFSKLFGKSVRIDRIHGLADALTYEVFNFVPYWLKIWCLIPVTFISTYHDGLLQVFAQILIVYITIFFSATRLL